MGPVAGSRGCFHPLRAPCLLPFPFISIYICFSFPTPPSLFHTHPPFSSVVTMATALRADGRVVTESEYAALGVVQTLTRSVEGPENEVYHVNNTMKLPNGRVLVADSYFDRVEEDGEGAT